MKLLLSLTAVLTFVANPILAAFPSLNVKAGATCPQRPSDAIPLFRADKPGADHFYSTADKEINGIVTSAAYQRKGSVGNIFHKQVAGTIPLHRLYLESQTDHTYTTTGDDKHIAASAGYRDSHSDQSPIGYLLQNGHCVYQGFKVLPLFRLYSQRETAHLLTHDAAERALVLMAGYKDAGTLGYVIVPS